MTFQGIEDEFLNVFSHNRHRRSTCEDNLRDDSRVSTVRVLNSRDGGKETPTDPNCIHDGRLGRNMGKLPVVS